MYNTYFTFTANEKVSFFRSVVIDIMFMDYRIYIYGYEYGYTEYILHII